MLAKQAYLKIVFFRSCLFCDPVECLLLQGVPLESHPSKLVGSRGSKSRYFDFEKLAEVCFPSLLHSIS